jgi:hypothetical protein
MKEWERERERRAVVAFALCGEVWSRVVVVSTRLCVLLRRMRTRWRCVVLRREKLIQQEGGREEEEEGDLCRQSIAPARASTPHNSNAA